MLRTASEVISGRSRNSNDFPKGIAPRFPGLRLYGVENLGVTVQD
jgi:hypothetical protein